MSWRCKNLKQRKDKQDIRFTDEDKLTAQDEVDTGKDMDKEMGFRPIGGEW